MPAALGQPGREAMRARRLGRRAKTGALQHEPASLPAIPAHPVHLHGDAARLRGAHVHPLDVARSERLLGHVAGDRAACFAPDELRRPGQTPGGGPASAILSGDRRRSSLRPHQPAISGRRAQRRREHRRRCRGRGRGPRERGVCARVVGCAAARAEQQAERHRAGSEGAAGRRPHPRHRRRGRLTMSCPSCTGSPSRTRAPARSARRPARSPARAP